MSVSEVKEFYSNDIVYRFDKRKRINFGVVVDSYEASTDSDEFNSLQKGQLRVWWFNNLREQVWRQSKVWLMSRTVIPGDVVRRLVQGKETQRGYCKESKQFATVQIIGTDKLIEKVHTQRLCTVSHFDAGVAICMDKQYGRIESVDQKITMMSKCGSIVEIFSSINHDIEDFWLTKRNRSYFGSFYTDQEVMCTPSSLEQPNWINKTKAMKRSMHTRQRFTVRSVEPCDVEVAWFDGPSGNSTATTLKNEEIKMVKVLEPFDDIYLELAERRRLKLSSSDVLLKKKDWLRKMFTLHRSEIPKLRHVVGRGSQRTSLRQCVKPLDIDEDWLTEEEDREVSENECSTGLTSNNKPKRRHFPPKPTDLASGHTLPVEVLCMESKATVVWQDGTEEKDIPTTQLYYSISLDDHEFFPGEWVVLEGKDNQAFGVVQFVDHFERTATVKWYTYSEADKVPLEVSTDEMSVYDLCKYPKFSFRPGSVVKRIPVEENKLGGVIDSCPQGYIVVQWLDGTRENCWPQNLELIPDAFDNEFSIGGNEDTAQVSWETESIESIAGDTTDETALQNMAARLDFVRSRIIYLKDAFIQHQITENVIFLRDLILVYDNSSYLDKLLDTSFFSAKSRHFQALLTQVKEKVKSFGVEFRGRLFSSVGIEGYCSTSQSKLKMAEKENISKVMKMEHKVNQQIETFKEGSKEAGEPSTPLSPDIDPPGPPHENLCIELLSMLKARMDLAYAEIISRIGGQQALTVMTKALEKTTTPLPIIPMTPDGTCPILTLPKLTKAVINCENEVYCVLDEAHPSHRFYSNKFEPTDKQRFFKAIEREYKLMRESLPPGVWVRSYENRMDLLSVMIRGPSKTPYEDGLFLFDIQLSADYPRSPPVCHFISYSTERLNPNLYVEGKVCVSLLGTWTGHGTEVWGPNSTLLQLIVSIQGLILVAEPYYNEAGYEKQSKSQQGYENSRTYNELVVLKLVQSMSEILLSPPEVFKNEVYNHFAANGANICNRLQRWSSDIDPLNPEFPLLPVSKGLKLSLKTSLTSFKDVLNKVSTERDGKEQS